jgi:hypothetical protein
MEDFVPVCSGARHSPTFLTALFESQFFDTSSLFRSILSLSASSSSSHSLTNGSQYISLTEGHIQTHLLQFKRSGVDPNFNSNPNPTQPKPARVLHSEPGLSLPPIFLVPALSLIGIGEIIRVLFALADVEYVSMPLFLFLFFSFFLTVCLLGASFQVFVPCLSGNEQLTD